MKKCNKCTQIKEFTSFHKSIGNKDGFRSQCKECRRNENLKHREKTLPKTEEYLESKREKIRERASKWYYKNKEKAKLRIKKWSIENSHLCKEYSQKYRDSNPNRARENSRRCKIKNIEKVKVRNKEWRKNNREKINAWTATRRCRRQSATPDWLTKEHHQEMREIYTKSLEISKTTGIEHQVDHIVPIQSNEVCGLHVPWNLQIITASANRKKHNKILS